MCCATAECPEHYDWQKIESVPSHKSDNTGITETISDVLDWVFLIMVLLTGGAKRYAKKGSELLH